MKPITQEQAAALKKLRPEVKILFGHLDHFSDVVANACDHDDSRTCRICRIARLLLRASAMLDPPGGGYKDGGLADLIDEALDSAVPESGKPHH